MNYLTKEKLEWSIQFCDQIHQGYGNYFFKKWKKTRDGEHPVPLLCIAVYSDFDTTDMNAKAFFEFVADKKVDLECGCGEQNLIDVLDESELKLASFKSLMTSLITEYMFELLEE